MDDQLLPWLRAQIAAARDRALGALRGYPMSMTRESWAAPGGDRVGADADDAQHWRSHQDYLYQVADPTTFVGGKQIATFPQGPLRASFAAAHGPQAALAQCEAHTAILAIHNVWAVVYPGDMVDIDPLDRHCVGCGFDALENERTPDVNNCPTLRAVALAYRHSPGYRAEWKP